MCDLSRRRCEDYATRLENVGTSEATYLEALDTQIEYFSQTACADLYGWVEKRCPYFWDDANKPALEATAWYFLYRAVQNAKQRLGRRWRPVYDRMAEWLMKRFFVFDTPEDAERLRDTLIALRGYGYHRLGRYFAGLCMSTPDCPSTSWRTWRDFLSFIRFRQVFLGVR